MAEPVGIGIIGLGRWAGAHAKAATRSDAMRLVNCFARTPETRAAFQEQWAVPSTSSSIDELLADPSVEGVVVSTPNDLHVEHALACVSAGRPVLMDKPVAVSTAEGLRLLRAAEDAGVPVGVAHHPRRLAGIRAARSWIESGDAGRVRLAHADFSNNRSASMPPDAWHRSARGSEAGVLIQVGIHQVDNLLHLLGPVLSVNARFTHETLGPTMPDLAAVTMTHVGGAVSVVTSSWTTPGYFSVELLATRGNLTFRLDHARWTDGDVDDHGEVILAAGGERSPYPVSKGDPLRAQLDELAGASRGGAMTVGIVDGLRAVLVVEAAVRSARAAGAPVSTGDLAREAGATTDEVDRLLSA